MDKSTVGIRRRKHILHRFMIHHGKRNLWRFNVQKQLLTFGKVFLDDRVSHTKQNNKKFAKTNTRIILEHPTSCQLHAKI